MFSCIRVSLGNNQTHGWNQPSENKKNYLKNQPNEELVLWEINKIEKLLTRLTRGHRNSILINKIRKEKGDITTNPEEIQNTVRIILQKAILKKTGEPEWNGQIPTQIPGTKDKSGSD
jgi:hypothetical protein